MTIIGKKLILLLMTLNEALNRVVESDVSLARPLEYSLYEELEVGTVVGDVRRDSNITRKYTEDEALLLRFSFRQSSGSWRLFTMDESQGVIRTAQVLDRDVLCAGVMTSCDLTLDVAVKPLQYFQIVKVVVHLVDINDNHPRFSDLVVRVSVAETALPGALFPLPVADDADSGQFGVQEYQLLSDFDCFELKVSDQVDGSKDVRLRLAKGLDRETVDRYHATLLALDGGIPQKSGSIAIEIVVLDSNDNSPKFQNSSYEVSVKENIPISTTIVWVHATDLDEGANGQVVYSFSDQTLLAHGSTFAIDNTSGAIYLKDSLDYEQVQTIQLTAKASDQGSGSLPAFAKVIVHIIDVNDNPPQISINVLTSSERAEVQENSDRGSFVAHVAVKDADLGSSGDVDCTIDSRDLFRLEPLFDSEYKLVTVVTFDREEQEVYSVKITCSDNGYPSLSSSETIKVFVTDENDHSPQISSPLYEVYLPENSPPNALVAKIEATDEDSGKNRALQYRIQAVDSTAEGTLSVNIITGKVTTNVAFDYEDRRQYTFLITVADQGDEPRTSTTSLVLHIQDVNDERPVFDRSSYHFSTRENLPIGTVLGRVSATDRDLSQEFKDIVYRLRFPSDVFEVDRISGEIVNMRRLDREAEPIHRLTVIASNRAKQVDGDLEGRANVTVIVEDENDNAPVFSFPNPHLKTVQLSGSSVSVGLFVTRLVASDPDSETNSQVSYEVLHGNEHHLFELDPATGIITIAKMPPTPEPTTERQGSNKIYRLTVAAKDSGSPPMASVADLAILLNNSVEPNYAAHAGGSGGLLDAGKIPILVGAVIGSLFVLAFVVIAAIFVHRHRRTAKQKISSPVVCEQLRPLSRAKNSCRSLNTVDSASISSAGSRETGLGVSVAGSCRRCRVGNAGGSMMLPVQDCDQEEEDSFLDRTPSHWPLRPAQSLRVPKKHESGFTTDVGLSVLQRPSYQDCSCRDRRTGPGRSCPHQQHQHFHRQQQQYCGMCGSTSKIVAQGACSRTRLDHHRQKLDPSGQRESRTAAAKTSNERTPIRRSPQGDVDDESACSYADSGRGPSEEEDLNNLVLAAMAAVASSSCSSSTATAAASVDTSEANTGAASVNLDPTQRERTVR